ncbi:MAG: aromatic acid decarboxylase [Acidimicrobiaceae bacterium]|nr:aromatic acid decarboxylase [Acidimicrobiaceae bacterium]MDC0212495.1 UbiX family flavin prenyltransferase [Euryarchaeota archaeon]|tara:strand:- start:4776 stop:5354 length:579 start_codon:yes stop_codon:yes gene_type:complete
MPKAVVAITGASGARYGVRLVEQLSDSGWDVDLIVTGAGAINLDLECGMEPDEISELNGVTLHHNANLAARPASGSAKYDACVVCPASGTTIGKIAAGISDNLATRSALVAIKERRKLILVPRETPMSTPHLEAMAKMSSWGVVILPANPGFYHAPTTIEELVDFVVARILDQLDVDHDLGKRWTGEEVSLD